MRSHASKSAVDSPERTVLLHIAHPALFMSLVRNYLGGCITELTRSPCPHARAPPHLQSSQGQARNRNILHLIILLFYWSHLLSLYEKARKATARNPHFGRLTSKSIRTHK